MDNKKMEANMRMQKDLSRVRAQFQMESLKQYMARPLTREELFERVIAEDLATIEKQGAQLST